MTRRGATGDRASIGLKTTTWTICDRGSGGLNKRQGEQQVTGALAALNQQDKPNGTGATVA